MDMIPVMRTASITRRGALFACLLVGSAAFGQAKKRASPSQSSNRLSLTCTQILKMTSTDWIARFQQKKGTGQPQLQRAIAAYGRCYDARTAQLAAGLARTRKGPSRADLAAFADFEKGLEKFTSDALAATHADAGATKAQYAALYEKQLRYQFYLGYEEKAAPAARPTPAAAKPESKSSAPQVPAGTDEKSAGQSDRSDQPDPLTLAKNRFGSLLGDLPEDQLHKIHAAFGALLGPRTADPETQLALYRYAIFVLEPPPQGGHEPFSPPPF